MRLDLKPRILNESSTFPINPQTVVVTNRGFHAGLFWANEAVALQT